MLSLRTRRGPATGSLNTPVKTVFPCQATSFGMPTLTDTNVPTACAAPPAQLRSYAPARRMLDALDELDAGLDRAAQGAGARDSVEAFQLSVVEVAAEPDCDLESAWRRLVVVVDVDRDLAEIPVLRACVHHERRRDAGGERGREQLVRRGPAAVAAEALRLVGDQAVLAVDQHLLPKGAGNRAG